MSLETPRLRLDPWSDGHADLLARLSSIPAVTRHIGSGLTWSEVKAQAVAAAAREHWREHGFGWRAAVEKATGRPVGFIALAFAGEGTPGLHRFEYEIGWWLDPRAWGRGLAREGALAVRAEAFGRVGAPSVVARIQPENAASIRVAESIGLALAFSTTGRTGEPISVYRLESMALQLP